MPPPHPPELRPYRVATYIVFLIFTFTFIILVVRSVWLDLYGREPGGEATHLTLVACQNEIEALRNRLESRLHAPLAPRAESNWPHFKEDWDTFARQFEDDLGRVQSQCSDFAAPAGSAIRESAERLDSLREHLARCGEEGEAEREALSASLRRLHDALSSKER